MFEEEVGHGRRRAEAESGATRSPSFELSSLISHVPSHDLTTRLVDRLRQVFAFHPLSSALTHLNFEACSLTLSPVRRACSFSTRLGLLPMDQYLVSVWDLVFQRLHAEMAYIARHV